eukprot:gene40256-14668_t
MREHAQSQTQGNTLGLPNLAYLVSDDALPQQATEIRGVRGAADKMVTPAGAGVCAEPFVNPCAELAAGVDADADGAKGEMSEPAVGAVLDAGSAPDRTIFPAFGVSFLAAAALCFLAAALLQRPHDAEVNRDNKEEDGKEGPASPFRGAGPAGTVEKEGARATFMG